MTENVYKTVSSIAVYGFWRHRSAALKAKKFILILTLSHITALISVIGHRSYAEILFESLKVQSSCIKLLESW